MDEREKLTEKKIRNVHGHRVYYLMNWSCGSHTILRRCRIQQTLNCVANCMLKERNITSTHKPTAWYRNKSCAKIEPEVNTISYRIQLVHGCTTTLLHPAYMALQR